MLSYYYHEKMERAVFISKIHDLVVSIKKDNLNRRGAASKCIGDNIKIESGQYSIFHGDITPYIKYFCWPRFWIENQD